MFGPSEVESLLQEITLEGRGETSGESSPMVLSCGGINFPKRGIPVEMKCWRPVVNIPSQDSSAKVFYCEPGDPQDEIVSLFLKETLN